MNGIKRKSAEEMWNAIVVKEWGKGYFKGFNRNVSHI